VATLGWRGALEDHLTTTVWVPVCSCPSESISLVPVACLYRGNNPAGKLEGYPGDNAIGGDCGGRD